MLGGWRPRGCYAASTASAYSALADRCDRPVASTTSAIWSRRALSLSSLVRRARRGHAAACSRYWSALLIKFPREFQEKLAAYQLVPCAEVDLIRNFDMSEPVSIPTLKQLRCGHVMEVPKRFRQYTTKCRRLRRQPLERQGCITGNSARVDYRCRRSRTQGEGGGCGIGGGVLRYWVVEVAIWRVTISIKKSGPESIRGLSVRPSLARDGVIWNRLRSAWSVRQCPSRCIPALRHPAACSRSIDGPKADTDP